MKDTAKNTNTTTAKQTTSKVCGRKTAANMSPIKIPHRSKTAPKPVSVEVGQLWHGNHLLQQTPKTPVGQVFVLSCNKESVVCQFVKLGITGSFPCERFSSGSTEFTFLCHEDALTPEASDKLHTYLNAGRYLNLNRLILK